MVRRQANHASAARGRVVRTAADFETPHAAAADDAKAEATAAADRAAAAAAAAARQCIAESAGTARRGRRALGERAQHV